MFILEFELIFLLVCIALILNGIFYLTKDKKKISEKLRQKNIPLSYKMLCKIFIFGLGFSLFSLIKYFYYYLK